MDDAAKTTVEQKKSLQICQKAAAKCKIATKRWSQGQYEIGLIAERGFKKNSKKKDARMV